MDKRAAWLVTMGLLGALGIWAVGCGPRPTVLVRSARWEAGLLGEKPAEVIVGRFGAGKGEDQPYAVFVRDYLKEKLAPRNQGAMESKAEGRRLHLQGRVDVARTSESNDGQEQREKVTAVFVMNDPNQGEVLRSEQQQQSAGAAEEEPRRVREALGGLADRFLQRLYGVEEWVSCRLDRGRSRADAQGRERAARGDYEGALGCFRQALDERPEDHAAIYNAGVMYESLGQGQRAREMYERAGRLARRAEYKEGWRRVDESLSRGGER